MAQTEPQTIALSIRRLLDGAPRIELTAVFPTREAFDVQLPTWRPGRYELGQFAQYVYAMEGQAADGTWNALNKTSLHTWHCLLYTSPSPRDYAASRMPSSA